MKNSIVLTVVALLFLFGNMAYAAENSGQARSSKTDNQVCENLKKQGATEEDIARQGCCSSHGGVCGCSGGKVSCCNGGNSKCACKAEDHKSM